MKPTIYSLLILLTLAGVCVSEGFGSTVKLDRMNFDPNRPAVPGELLVKFRPLTLGENPTQIDGVIQTVNDSVNRIFAELKVDAIRKVFQSDAAPLNEIYHLHFDAPLQLSEALTRLASASDVEWLEPNYLSYTSAAPNDLYFPSQWGLEKIQAEAAWDISQGSSDIVIAIIDTGVDYDHLDMEGNIWHNPGEIPGNNHDDDENGYRDDDIGWDFVSVFFGGYPGEDMAPRDRDPMDFDGHGTGCAGIASAVTNNTTGMAGVGWNCKIMCLRAGYKNSSGDGVLADSDTAAALVYAAENGAHIVSMSWGASGISYTLQDAIEEAYDAGCVLVAAAGNSANSTPHYPAALPEVIAVAASDENDARASFSNYGNWVDIVAPGKSIHGTTYNSTVHNNTYALWSGTSMSTPIVAGAAGLLLSHEPTLTIAAVKNRLLDSADTVQWQDVGLQVKRLNAYQALLMGNEQTIAVLDPGGGDSIKGGDSVNMLWETTGEDIDHIHLSYSPNNGANYVDIAASTPDDGVYEWDPVPALNSSAVIVKAIAEDASGLPLAQDVSESFTVDSDSPETSATLDGTEGENGWYLSDVEVTLSAADNLTGINGTHYRINDGEWQTYSEPLVVSGSTIHYYSEDGVGNVESAKEVEINIDKLPPETTPSLAGTPGENGWYKSDVTVTLSATDDLSGVDWTQYKIDDGTWQPYSVPFVVSGSTVYYKSRDIAGNTESEQQVDINIDKIPPTTSASPAGTPGENGWYKSDVTVTLSATDDLSGIQWTQYKINDGPWQPYSAPFVVSGSTVYYKSKDIAGNTESEQQIDINIDKIPPTTSASPAGTLGENGWYKSDVTVTLSATDDLSGVDWTQYKVNDGAWQTYSAPFVVSGSTVYYKSKDIAGNTESEKQININIDKVPPTTAASLVGTLGENGWYKSDVTVTLSATDDLSGVDWTQYKINDGAWQTYSTPFVVSGSTVYCKSKDIAGNTESEQQIEINIDEVPPTTAASLAGTLGENGWYKSNVTVTLSATDAPSGVDWTQYKINDGSWQTYSVPFAVSSSSTVYHRSKDIAGNLEIQKQVVVNIDTVPPTTAASLAGTLGENGWYKSNVTVTLSATDNLSGIQWSQYKISDNSWQTYSVPFAISSSSTVYYRSKDVAGNLEIQKQVVINIDKVLPTTTASLAGTLGENGWYKSDVTVTLSATDNPSGIQLTQYKINDGSWQTYSAPFAVSGSTVYYKSKDVAGNIEAQKQVVINIDKVLPTTTASLAGTLGENGWYKSNVTVTLSATDNLSGVDWIQYKINDGSWQTYSAPFVVSGSTVYYKSKDIAGNAETQKQVAINIDKIPPTTTASLAGTLGNNGWYTSDVTVTLSATDDVSGVGTIYYSINPDAWGPYSVPVVVSSCVFYYRSKDQAGNMESAKSQTIKVDKTAPSVPIVTDDGVRTYVATQIHASWSSSSDANSGIVEYLYAVGTQSNGSDLSNWTSAGTNTEVTAAKALTAGETYYVGVRSKNGAGLLSNTGISDGITVNSPPVVADIPDVSFDEDGSNNAIDLDNYVDDPDDADSVINWSYGGNTNVNVDINPATHLVTFTAPSNWNGGEIITFTAVDTGGLNDSDDVIVTVNPVNDPPTATNLAIEPVPTGPDDDLVASYTYSDVEGDPEDSSLKWYRNNSYQPPYDDALTIPSSATTPGEDWYFIVTPGDGIDMGQTHASPHVVIGGVLQSFHFYPGWNLFSITSDPAVTDISSVLLPIDGLYTSVWAYDAAAGVWLRYTPGGPANALNAIEPGKGYWIDMIGEAVFDVIGDQIDDPAISLFLGWNLIGYNSLTDLSIQNLLSQVNCVSIWTYDSEAKVWLRHVIAVPAFLNTLDKLESGRGYWIDVQADSEWTLSP